MPQDKTAEIEERFARLEEKLRVTFLEIDKRLPKPEEHKESPLEERIDELEDLLLLLQLENTKLKEKVGEGLDFGISPSAPGVNERLEKIEEELSSGTSPVQPGDIDVKIATLEERINALPSQLVQVPQDVEARVKESMEKDVQEMQKRIRTLEALLEKRGQEEIENSSLLADVHTILKR